MDLRFWTWPARLAKAEEMIDTLLDGHLLVMDRHLKLCAQLACRFGDDEGERSQWWRGGGL